MIDLPDSSASYAFDIDTQAGLALARTAGTLTGTDMKLIVHALHADPRWKPHFDAIWDCRAVQSHAVRPSEVGPIVQEAMEQDAIEDEPTGRDIMIEAGGIVESAISQLIAALCRRAGKEVRVVGTMEQALDLLDRTELPDSLQAVAEAG